MSKRDVIRAWKDEAYRKALGEQNAQLPENPAGHVELSPEEIEALEGGFALYCCTATHHCAFGFDFLTQMSSLSLR